MKPITPLLEVEGLRTHFRTRGKVNRSVDGLSFHVHAGESVAIVGESGCGKSVTAMTIMRLLASKNSASDGAIRFDGVDLLQASERTLRGIRGNAMSMIFQDPMSSLNPVLTVGRQLCETLRLHQKMSAEQASARALEMLTLVRISEPARRLGQYPHELSGGMRQRVMIAMALACKPRLLIADEPTTALDVTVQAQILDLLRNLRDTTGTAIILITHDLGVVAEMAERVIVMYAGRKVEEAPVASLFANPLHPYTQALLKSMPHLSTHDGTRNDAGANESDQSVAPRLQEIPGVVPALVDAIPGCIFAPRCSLAKPHCFTAYPPLRSVDTNTVSGDGAEDPMAPRPSQHSVACWEAVLPVPLPASAHTLEAQQAGDIHLQQEHTV